MPALRAILRSLLYLPLALLVLAVSSPITVAADEDFAVAANYYAAHRWQLAAAEFRSFCQRDPQHPRVAEAEFFLAESLVQLGQLKDASERYEQFLLQHDQHPLAERALFRWGECSYRDGNQPVALRLLRQFSTQYPDHELNAYALPYLAHVLANADLRAEAAQTLQRALDRFPQGPLADDCLLQLAIDSYRQQHYDASLADLDRLRQAFPASRRQPDVCYWRGAVLLARREYEAAAAEFQQVTPSETARDRKPAAQYFRGECLLCLGQWQQAEQAFRELVETDDRSEWTGKSMVGLMRIALRQDDHEQVDRWAARVEQAFPVGHIRLKACQLQAVSLLRRHRADEAAALLEGAAQAAGAATIAELEPAARKTTLYLLALTCLANAHPEEALCLLKIEPVVEPTGDLDAQIALACATALGELGAHTESITVLRTILTQHPQGDLATRCRALLIASLLASGQPQVASEIFADWPRESAPSLARATAAGRLAEAASARGDMDRALELYGQVVEGQGEPASVSVARLRIAQLHERRGESAAALALLDQILADDADFDQIHQVHYLRGWVLRQLGRTEPAAAEFQLVHERFPASLCWADATYRLAEQTYQARQFDRSAELLQELLQAEPSDATHRLLPYTLYLQGRLAVHRQAWDQVARCMRQILAEHAGAEPAVDAQFWLAESLYQLADYDAAASQFATASTVAGAAQQPWLTRVPLRQAQILAAQRQWPEALAASQTVAAQSTTAQHRREAELVAGRSLTALGRLDEARAAFQRVVDDPDAAGTETAASAQWMIGETYLHQKQYREALRLT